MLTDTYRRYRHSNCWSHFLSVNEILLPTSVMEIEFDKTAFIPVRIAQARTFCLDDFFHSGSSYENLI